MRIFVLCLVFLILAACGEIGANSPTPPERGLTWIAHQEHACGHAEGEPTMETCNLFLRFSNGRMGHVVEIDNDIPYIERSPGGDTVRYATWLGAESSNGMVRIIEYAGPAHHDHYEAMWDEYDTQGQDT
jgi:hypothetical protein